jgi:single-strand DNA-binding protein
MNKVVLMGRLTRDPEVRYTSANNTMVATFQLAVSRRFAREGQQDADFIYIVAWDKTAEFVTKHFRKGQQVGVIGRIQTRNYDDKDGKKVFVTEVVAEETYFADSKREPEQNPFGNEPEHNPFVSGPEHTPFGTGAIAEEDPESLPF